MTLATDRHLTKHVSAEELAGLWEREWDRNWHWGIAALESIHPERSRSRDSGLREFRVGDVCSLVWERVDDSRERPEVAVEYRRMFWLMYHDVTFACDDEHLIATLATKAATTALDARKRRNRIEIEDSALAALFKETQGYTHFVQLAGASIDLWVRENGKVLVRPENLPDALTVYRKHKEGEYTLRYDEIGKLKLEEAATNVAEMTKGGKSWSKRAILSKIDLPPDKTEIAFDRLCDIGLIWNQGRNRFSAGIPSFASYVVEMVDVEQKELDSLSSERQRPELPSH